MSELNEKLATEVMGWHEVSTLGAWWWKSDGDGGWIGQCRLESWNPTTDLNQLKMCYEAAERGCKKSFPEVSFAGDFYWELEQSVTNGSRAKLATAWAKHPELVAQAILNAKGVS